MKIVRLFKRSTIPSPIAENEIGIFADEDGVLKMIDHDGTIKVLTTLSSDAIDFITSLMSFISIAGDGLIYTEPKIAFVIEEEALFRLGVAGEFNIYNSGGHVIFRIDDEGQHFLKFTALSQYFEIRDHSNNPIFRIDEDGTPHIKSGATWHADL